MRVRVSHVEGGVGKRTRENNKMGEKIPRCVNTSKFGFFYVFLCFWYVSLFLSVHCRSGLSFLGIKNIICRVFLIY